jgi:hypothetical protein
VKVAIKNDVLSNKTSLNVLLISGACTFVYTGVSSVGGVIEIKVDPIKKGMFYTAQVIDEYGITIATAYPVVAS